MATEPGALLDQALGRLGLDVAIDLGTANTRIHQRGKGMVFAAPTVVAVERSAQGSRVVATGVEAKRMLGRTPEHITAVRPIQGGVIRDFTLVEELLRDSIRQVTGTTRLSRARVMATVSQATSDVERRALQEAMRALGARQVSLVPKSIAAAVGAGLPVHDAQGSVVVDIGAGVTEVAVLSLGGLVDSTSVRIAGNSFDDAIVAHTKKHHNVLLGARAAEEVKLAIACASPRTEPAELTLTGRDLSTGIPREVTLTGDGLLEPIQHCGQGILEALRQVLSRVSPEIAADIAEFGVVLTGGTSRLPGLDRWVQEATGLGVHLADDPERCSCLGAAQILAEPDAAERLCV